MVAASTEAGLRLGDSKPGVNRWNLKTMTLFPQWELDTLRAFRQFDINHEFLSSTRPVYTDMDPPQPGVKREKTGAKPQEELFRKILEKWDEKNKLVYEMLEDRIHFDSEADLITVRHQFGDLATDHKFKGTQFWAWIQSHRNDAKESTQLALEKKIKSIHIGANATVDEVDAALSTIQADWPKCRLLEQTAIAAIKHSLRVFDHAHPQHGYIRALQAQIATAQKAWTNYGAFRAQLVEHFAVEAEHDQARQFHTSMPAFPNGPQPQGKPGDRQKQPKPKNECDHCDLRICSAKKGQAADKCVLCSQSEIEALTSRKTGSKGKRLMLLLRMYKKDKNLSSMKGVKAPAEWLAANAKRLPDSEKTDAEKNVQQGSGLAAMELPAGADGNFWESLAQTTHESLLVTMEQHEDAAILEDEEDERMRQTTMDQLQSEDVIDTPKNDNQTTSEVDQLTVKIDLEQPQQRYDFEACRRDFEACQRAMIAAKAVTEPTLDLRTPEASGSNKPQFIEEIDNDTVQRKLEEVIRAQQNAQQAQTTSSIDYDPTPRNAEIIRQLEKSSERMQAEMQEKSEELARERMSSKELQGTVSNLMLRFEEVATQLKSVQRLNAKQAEALEAANAKREQQAAAMAAASIKREQSAAKLSVAQSKLSQLRQILGKEAPSTDKIKLAIGAMTLMWVQAKYPTVLNHVLRRFKPIVLALLTALKRASMVSIKAIGKLITDAIRHYIVSMLVKMEWIPEPTPPVSTSSIRVMQTAPQGVMMTASANNLKTTKAVMLDSGCTSRMTCTLQGLVGELRKLKNAPTYVTALGEAKYDQIGTFSRRIYGANGEFFEDTGEWLYNPALPFDVMGTEWMRKNVSAFYHDSDRQPWLELRSVKQPNGSPKLLALGRAQGGTEWLSYEAPPRSSAERVQAVLKATAMAITDQAEAQNIALPLNTTGPGMFTLQSSLTDFEKAKLDHVLRGHASMRRCVESQHHSTGGFKLTADAIKKLAIDGCDLCGAYKIKHLQPKEKEQTPEEDASATNLKLYYDSFGRVSQPSAQFSYHYAHLFWIPSKVVGWLLGSTDLTKETVGSLIKRVLSAVAAWLPNFTIQVLQMDSFSTNRSEYLLKILEEGMIKPNFTPPGQHAYLGDLERMWYTLLVRALIMMRHGEAPRSQWFNAMMHALDVECTLVSRMHGTGPNISGYERLGLGVPHIDDLFPFYAPSRFALDKDARADKWQERSAPGFWVGRDIDFVMKGKKGAGIFWDGHIHRTIVQNFHVTVSKYLDLTAPNNKQLPDFPKDSNPMPGSQPPQQAPAQPQIQQAPQQRAAPQQVPITAAATRPRRPGADITYTSFVCEIEILEEQQDGQELNVAMAVHGPMQQPSPAADIVLHIACGDYDNANGISALLRVAGCGVVDIDNHEQYGGGAAAHMLNNGVFNFIWQLTRAQRVIGIISGQPCSTGSLKRLESAEGMPQQVLSQQYPDGMPDLNAAYRKEVHDCALLGYRITALIDIVWSQGGWFIAECPEVRGNPQRILSFNPSFETHSTVMDMQHWQALAQKTGAHRICAAMCALREGYPQKLESIMISPNLAPTLLRQLQALECTHVPGTHDNSFAGEQRGKWNVSSSQTWLLEFCKLIRDGVLPLTPKGGPSLQLGRDDLPTFVHDVLQWRDTQHLAVLRQRQPALCPSPKAAMILAIAHDIDNRENLPCPEYHDADPHYHKGKLSLLEPSDGGSLTLSDFVPEIQVINDEVALLVEPSTHVPRDPAPQTERELRNSRDMLHWMAADQVEIDTLFGMHTLEEVLDPGGKAWRTRFVRAEKTDPITYAHSRRSRLCCMGTGQEEGQEYYESSVPTPMWSTSLMLVGECTVAQGIDFQFDCPQFFQQTDCETPTGPLLLIPPPRYQRRENGVRVLWKCIKWLQGAKGAGAAARKSFNELVTKNEVLKFTLSSWDPSLYIHSSEEGKIRFCLHGDDGCGGWSTSQVLIDKLHAMLTVRYGKFKAVKFGPWGKQLGFPIQRDLKLGTTTIVSTPYVEGLRKLVEDDQPYKPKLPYSKEISELEPAELPTPGSPEETEFAADIAWMREACGRLIHIGKVRKDIVPAVNMCSRYSHRPDKKAKRCVKHIIWYLLNTPDLGLTFGYSADTKWDDLTLREAPPRDDIFDTMAPRLYYWINCDGALKVDDRSLSGILHIFAGACFLGLSFRQHSTATCAHDSEAFTASTATAQAIPFRGILTELGIVQATPTPIVVDSRSTLLVARDKAAMKKSLYIMRRVVFMQECVDDGEVEMYSCKGKMNLSDCFTKPIFEPTPFFQARRYYMGCKGAAVNG